MNECKSEVFEEEIVQKLADSHVRPATVNQQQSFQIPINRSAVNNLVIHNVLDYFSAPHKRLALNIK